MLTVFAIICQYNKTFDVGKVLIPADLKTRGGDCVLWGVLVAWEGAWLGVLRPSFGLRSWGLSDLEEDEDEAVSTSLTE